MQLLKHITRLVQDPPPEFVFELAEAGIAWTRRAAGPRIAFQPLEAGVLDVSPLKDNVLKPDALEKAVRNLVNGGGGGKKRRRAALILPDYCSRFAVIDFDAFPSRYEEQEALVRFRAKRAASFDIDSAVVGFRAQQRPGEKRYDVVVVSLSLEILARYEAPFRAAGLHPGFVTTSALAASALVPAAGVALTLKLDGCALSVWVQSQGLLRLMRSMELRQVSVPEVMSVLYPTLAFTEDESGQRPGSIFICGFEDLAEDLRRECQAETGILPELLRSRFGTPGPGRAGLLGYLETIEG
jgi:type IV pilus assembly protein PilM